MYALTSFCFMNYSDSIMSCQGHFWMIYFFFPSARRDQVFWCVYVSILRDTCLVCVRVWIKWLEKVKMKGVSESWVCIVYHHKFCSDLQVPWFKKGMTVAGIFLNHNSVRFERVGLAFLSFSLNMFQIWKQFLPLIFFELFRAVTS